MTLNRLIIVIAWPITFVLDIWLALSGIDSWLNLRNYSNTTYKEMW